MISQNMSYPKLGCHHFKPKLIPLPKSMGTYWIPRLKINLAQNSSQITRVRILHKNVLCIIEEDGAYVEKHNNTCAGFRFLCFS
jgi:G:T-mismatch repair DNA endonuclease (very short patch repair protein)